MNNYSLFFVALAILFSSSLFGQISYKLDYSKYKPGEQRYRFLNYGFNAEASKRSFFGVQLDYNSFRNTANRQTEISFSGGLKSIESPSLSFDFNFPHRSRFYFSKKHPLLFIPSELGVSRESLGTQVVYTNTELRLASGIGLGRISVLNEVDIAERMVEKLEAIKGSVGYKEKLTFQLADFLAEVKNERFITNRGSWKDEIELIETKLIELGYMLTQEQIEKLVKETYGRESLIRREQGNTLSLLGGYNWGRVPNDFKDRNNSGRSFGVVAESKNYLGSKWQLNHNLSLRYTDANESVNRLSLSDFVITEFEMINIDFSSKLHYMPDLDTRFSIGLSGGYQRVFNYRVTTIDGTFRLPSYDEHLSGTKIQLELDYEKRIKRNLAASIGLDLGYSTIEDIGPLVNLRFRLRF